jgi:hypothetical protein
VLLKCNKMELHRITKIYYPERTPKTNLGTVILAPVSVTVAQLTQVGSIFLGNLKDFSGREDAIESVLNDKVD